ncbi:hypothetical protein [Methyloprofundus sp.]|uniref:hypothetical protein n=1 Tax=Methyloprofundus sp. TaxID=2020875 RepID=UPI003D12F83E
MTHFSSRRIVAIQLFVAILFISSCNQPPDPEEQIENILELLELPANQWVKYHHADNGDWWKKGHAGMAYDSKRGSLLIFGSDTHGKDWDNTVHEFSPAQRRWVQHGENSPQTSYRVDAAGIPVSGIENTQPWAMHTYDGIEYDPVSDSLFAIAAPDHNPIGKTISPSGKNNPIWKYALETQKWQALQSNATQKSNFFAAATAFDTARKALMICSHGLWSLKSGTQTALKIFSSPDCLHSSMAYDSWHKDLYLFGTYRPSNLIWKLDRDILTDEPVEWLKLAPGGDSPPPFTTTPVAFDQQAGVFLFVADKPGKDTNSASTFVYNPTKNQYYKLANVHLPKVGMNFMMTWAQEYKVFFLVTGGWDNGITVWALRLDLKMLEANSTTLSHS